MTVESDWFDIGWAVYRKDLRNDASFPPLNDMQAQRWWLGGFGTAWAENVAGEGESVDAALMRVLAGKEDLMRQLRSHRTKDGGAGRCSRKATLLWLRHGLQVLGVAADA